MSNTTPKPLWSEERIAGATEWAKYRGISAGTRIMLEAMRDEYEADRAALTARIEALIAERDDAWAQHGSITQHRDALASECHRLKAENDALRQQLAEWQQLHARCTTSLITELRRVERLKQQLAERDEWEVCDIDTKFHLITRAQFRGLETCGYRLQRRAKGDE